VPNFRRAYVPGGSFFFTLVTYNRARIFADETAQKLLGNAIRDCQADWPFEINALVLLPDHLHAIWSLPRGDTKYSARWSMIKGKFTQDWLAAGGTEQTISDAQQSENRRGVWQPRFWEHTLEDADDFERHFDYAHFNPVKHRYVQYPHQWPCSTFHRWVKAGVYPANWATEPDAKRRLNLHNMERTVGEPNP